MLFQPFPNEQFRIFFNRMHWTQVDLTLSLMFSTNENIFCTLTIMVYTWDMAKCIVCLRNSFSSVLYRVHLARFRFSVWVSISDYQPHKSILTNFHINVSVDILDLTLLKSTYFFCEQIFTFENGEKLKHVNYMM